MVHSLPRSASTRHARAPAIPSGTVARQSLLKKRLETRNSTTICKLLTSAGILSVEEMRRVQEMAALVKTSLDGILLRSAYIPREYREDVCRAADFVDRGIISEELAVAGLRSAFNESTTFEQGLKYHGWGW